MSTMTGGCLCGQVRYVAKGAPVFSGVCHCRDCQRYTGASFSPVLAFPSDAVSIEGGLKTFDSLGDSGQPVHRGFCPNCGSGISDTVDVMPGVTMIMAGTLDDTTAFVPAMEIYCSRAQPWVHAESERPRFDKMPPQG